MPHGLSSVVTGATPLGTYLYGAITGGTFNTTNTTTGPPLHATFLPGGSDYIRLLDDGSIATDLTAAAQDTNSTDLFHFSSYGMIGPGLNLIGSIRIGFGQLDAYYVLRVNAASKKYGWLNSVPLVAQEKGNIVNGVIKRVGLRV